MKVFIKNKITAFFSIFVLLFSFACSDLEEQILDESLTGNANNVDLASSAIGPAYALLPELYKHTEYFALQSIPTDEAILPARGGKDWFDGGKWIELNAHTYTSNNGALKDVWDDLTKLISNAVSAIEVLEPLAENDNAATIFLGEAQALYAFYNHLALDLWGIVFKKENAGEMSEIIRRDEAVKHIAEKYEEALANLSDNVGSGRMNQAAVKGLLARLYLNAPVYRNPYASNYDFTNADMDMVIKYCDETIAMGKHSLSEEYFDLFGNNNYNNKEILWAIDQRPDLNGHNRLSYFSMSRGFYGNVNGNGYQGYGTDAAAITSDFYKIWTDAYGQVDPTDADGRFYWERIAYNPDHTCVKKEDWVCNRGIFRGWQIGLKNNGHKTPFVECPDHPGQILLDTIRHSKIPGDNRVFFSEQVDNTPDGNHYNAGYRVLKYEWSSESEDGRGRGMSDIVVIRLADIYMMRAEAKLRKGDAAGALADVNKVRTSRKRKAPEALPAIDLNNLYRERGFEFYWEHHRRTDMIRFGKYESTWTEKDDSDPKKRLFPIPQAAIDGASINEGYLVQNEGY